MKIYLAGKITGNENFVEEFKKAELTLKEAGHVVINPSLLPVGFEHSEYMKVCLPMVGICDAIYLLNGWESSRGANMEKDYAESWGKLVIFEANEITEVHPDGPACSPEIVAMMQDGTLCERCGCHMGKPTGYLRLCEDCGGDQG